LIRAGFQELALFWGHFGRIIKQGPIKGGLLSHGLDFSLCLGSNFFGFGPLNVWGLGFVDVQNFFSDPPPLTAAGAVFGAKKILQ
jgi:hypothetical protein